MKIKDTGPVSAAGAVRAVRRAEAAQDNAPTPHVSAISDRISVLGIPPEEITPKVKEAIMRLLQEVETLRREVEGKQRRLVELEKLANLDPLAPIANRRAFVRELSRVISYVERYDVPASLLFFDVNDLKSINDAHGHGAGDAVLMHVANSLLANVRESDVVGRMGGDEFAVLLVQATEEQALGKGSHLAQRISDSPLRYDGKDIHVRVAFGAYTFKAGEKPTEILNQADKRMYAHKRTMKSA